MTDRVTKIDRFLQTTGWSDASRQLVAGDASNRRYFRLQRESGETAILMDAPPQRGESVAPFIAIAEHLKKVGLSAPQTLARDTDAGLLIIEDFGDALFADLMADTPAQETALYRAACDVLIHLQGTPALDLPKCDAAWVMDMMEPLFEWYAPDTTQDDIAHFKTLFQAHIETVVAKEPVMILRDYHAQNLLLLSDRQGAKAVGLLDFQDAMQGHPTYDLVSILQDARRDVDETIEARMVAYFLDNTDHDADDFRRAYAVLGLQRNLRILGIFARLCLRDGKAQYVAFIPRVWAYITRNLRHPDLAPLAAHLNSILPKPNDAYLEELRAKCPQIPSQP